MPPPVKLAPAESNTSTYHRSAAIAAITLATSDLFCLPFNPSFLDPIARVKRGKWIDNAFPGRRAVVPKRLRPRRGWDIMLFSDALPKLASFLTFDPLSLVMQSGSTYCALAIAA